MKSINEKQKEAIEFGQGQLLIIAGAGTGKTTVITERIRHLIDKENISPSEILALTFTEKASDEMQARVDEMMPYGYFDMWIMTFHSFCDRILKQEAINIGINPRYKLMSEVDEISLIRKHLFDFDLDYFRPLGNPNKFIQGLLEHFSRLSDEDIAPSEYLSYAKKMEKSGGKNASDEESLEIKKTSELSRAYAKYQEIKLTEGLLNFSDLIFYTLELFRKRKNILKIYREQFKYILVDEYQDTNITQNELIKLLSGSNGNITVVADDDQSIYKWRGASVSNVINFRKNFPHTKIITLTQNYRSIQEILDRSYDLITHNNPNRLEVREGIDKRLVSEVKGTDHKITCFHCQTSIKEANCVADEIVKLAKEKGYAFSDIAILVRANAHADSFMKSLAKRGIPYQFLGPGDFLKEESVVELVSFLKVLVNPHDSLAFYKLLGIEELKVPQKEIILLNSLAKRNNDTLFETTQKQDLPISDDAKEKLAKIHELIDVGIKQIKKDGVGKILFAFIDKSGIKDVLYDPQTADQEERALTVSKLFEKLEEFEMETKDTSVTGFLEWYDLMLEVGERPQVSDLEKNTRDAVNVLTVHSSKGLEFRVVFMVNLVSLRFPSTDKKELIPIPDDLVKETLISSNFHLEEERRLFYVGMTRSKEKLYFTFADYYADGKRIKKVSPFVMEALGELYDKSKEEYKGKEQLTLLDGLEIDAKKVSIENDKTNIYLDHLSVSQIETFDLCPLHYKLKYILKIPTPPSAASSFGVSIHEALRDFFEKAKTKKRVNIDTLLTSLEVNWLRTGYASKAHEIKNLQRAKAILTKFFEKDFNSKHLPVLLEQSFSLKLPISGNKDLTNKTPLTIIGKIDRVDVINDNLIEVIDYKTSKLQTQKEVEKELQLGFYALAANRLKEYPFDRKPENILLSYHFLDTGEKVSIQKTAKALESVINTIYEFRDKIEASDFTCSNHFFCKTCEYQGFCK